MTVRQIERARLAALLPPLTSSHALVALVPATSDQAWAAQASWSFARAAATGGRAVVLVDLALEEPCLHRPIGDTADDGIVDAFEYGTSLGLVTREHLNGSLFFIPAGSAVADPRSVLASPRWSRLAAGFRSENALLAVFLPPSALEHLGARPDAVFVLAPHGYSRVGNPIPALERVLERGVPLGGVVCEALPVERPRPAVRRPPRASRGSVTGSQGLLRHRRRSSARRRALWVGGVVVAVAGGALALGVGRDGDAPVSREATEATVSGRGGEGPDDATPLPPAPVAAAEPPPRAFTGDYPFVLQVAAYDAPEPARDRAADLARLGTPTLVTPVALGALGRWYRVYLGPFASEREAVDARSSLWNARALPRNDGMVRRAPFALEVGAEAAEAVSAAGLVPYELEGRWLVGAFEVAEQAAVTREMLVAAAIPSVLVERTGSRR